MRQGLAAGVLTWRSPATLQATLSSYRNRGLDRLLDERFVLVQEAQREECAIAESFGWTVIAPTDNLGISGGYRRLIEEASCEFFLFLECDWRLTRAPEPQIAASTQLIEGSHAAVVRLRDARRPGFPLGVLRMQNREHQHPDWLLESIFYEPEPWRVFPGHIRRLDEGGCTFALARPENAAWSNNPHLARLELLRRLVPDGEASPSVLEGSLTAGAYPTGALIAHAQGLFTHARLDGPAINQRDARYRFDQRMRWATRAWRRRMRPTPDGVMCAVCGLSDERCQDAWRTFDVSSGSPERD